MKKHFDHEKLAVYQKSLDFIEIADSILEDLPKTKSVCDQLERASTSIPLNIAEGNGKYKSADRCRFFDIARGSALECAATLDVLLRKNMILPDEASQGKECLVEIVSMLVGLVKSNASDRIYEEQADYGAPLVDPSSDSAGFVED